MPWVYIAQCADESFYVGHTTDLAAREYAHNLGLGSRFTAKRRPVRIVYAEEHERLTSALTRERQLKGWSSAKKAALIRGDLGALKRLSKRRKSR